MIEISINVLNYNSYEKTRRCIYSCLRCMNEKCRLLLIDNNSTDGSANKLKEDFHDAIDYLDNIENFGYAKANNIGIRYNFIQGIMYSFILNNDTEIIGEDLFDIMYRIASTNECVGIVAPLVFNVEKDGNRIITNDSGYLKSLRLLNILPQNRRKTGDTQEISEAHGSALFIRNSTFLSVGGFPEHYYMYGEESCLSKKLIWNKYKIIWYKSSNNYVLHYHDKSQQVDGWRLYLMGRNKILEYKENQKEGRLRWGVVVFVSCMITRIRRISDKNWKYYFIGIRDGISISRLQCSESIIRLLAIEKVRKYIAQCL